MKAVCAVLVVLICGSLPVAAQELGVVISAGRRVVSYSDIELAEPADGVILQSTNGVKAEVFVHDDGTIDTVPASGSPDYPEADKEANKALKRTARRVVIVKAKEASVNFEQPGQVNDKLEYLYELVKALAEAQGIDLEE